jgi:hypothetical protein
MGKRKLIAEMSPEERDIQREKWRTERAQYREQNRKARHLPTAEEWSEEFSKTPQYKELRQYAEKFSNKVTEEIGQLTIGEGYAAELVAWTLLSLKKNWVRDVWEPYGEHFAGGKYFADAIGSVIVEAAHRSLDKSPTFTAVYKELLPILDNNFGHDNTEDSRDIKAEIAGKYVLPVPPQPKPAQQEPKPVEASPVPTSSEVLERGRVQLLNQLSIYDSNLSPDARRYLDGF